MRRFVFKPHGLKALALAVLLAASCAPAPKPSALGPLRLTQISFNALQGWAANDPRAGLAAFLRSCGAWAAKPDTALLQGAGYAGTAGDWRAACAAASSLSPQDATDAAARGFFETQFVPYRLSEGEVRTGLFTGYYEPQLRGSRTRHGAFQTPLYAMPPDLIAVDLGQFRENLKGQRLAGRLSGRNLVPYPPRADIVRDGVPGGPLLYVDDPVDAFFLQIQGSGRITLDDGSVMRAAYAGQNGQTYVAIGGVLVEEGALKREEVSLQSIRAWLAAHPDRAAALLDKNPSYVFFALQPVGDPSLGAAGSAGVALTPGASLAVDVSRHPLGAPVWLEASVPDPDQTKPDRIWDRLLVTQDTGGAIKGVVRGDVYWGFGAEAASIAGRMKSQGMLTIFLPKALAARLGPRFEPGAGI